MGVYVRQVYDCPQELWDEILAHPETSTCHNCRFFLNPDCMRYGMQVPEGIASSKDVCEGFTDIFSEIPWRDYGTDQTD